MTQHLTTRINGNRVFMAVLKDEQRAQRSPLMTDFYARTGEEPPHTVFAGCHALPFADRVCTGHSILGVLAAFKMRLDIQQIGAQK